MYRVGLYTIPNILAHIWSWHIANEKVTISCINPLGTGCVLDKNVSTSYPCDLISLHWFLSANIFLVKDFCRSRW